MRERAAADLSADEFRAQPDRDPLSGTRRAHDRRRSRPDAGLRRPGGIEVTFVPGAGMVVCSLLHRGEEVLGQRRGLREYMEHHSTMGIPLLYPWANRVSRDRFEVAGRTVDLGLASPPSRRIRRACRSTACWRRRLAGRSVTVVGQPSPGELRLRRPSRTHRRVPVPARAAVRGELRAGRCRSSPRFTPSGPVAVPIAFGYHPYFVLPGVERAEWEVEIPVAERMVLDGGCSRPVAAADAVEPAALGSTDLRR